MTPWTVAHQAPLVTEISRQEYWSRLPFPTPGDHPNPRIEAVSLCLLNWQTDSLLPHHLGRLPKRSIGDLCVCVCFFFFLLIRSLFKISCPTQELRPGAPVWQPTAVCASASLGLCITLVLPFMGFLLRLILIVYDGEWKMEK